MELDRKLNERQNRLVLIRKSERTVVFFREISERHNIDKMIGILYLALYEQTMTNCRDASASPAGTRAETST